MNTQSHAIINVALLSRKATPHLHRYALIGAALPDLPMFIFFAVEAFILRHPQRLIWGERYFLSGWQNLFDIFNSIPLFLILLGIGYWRKSNPLIICSLSLLLHAAGDFFLHQDDGHRHFFPLLQYRFHSPVSYWDPSYHGGIVSAIEILVTIGASVYLFPRLQSRFIKGALVFINLVSMLMYIGFIFFD